MSEPGTGRSSGSSQSVRMERATLPGLHTRFAAPDDRPSPPVPCHGHPLREHSIPLIMAIATERPSFRQSREIRFSENHISFFPACRRVCHPTPICKSNSNPTRARKR